MTSPNVSQVSRMTRTSNSEATMPEKSGAEVAAVAALAMIAKGRTDCGRPFAAEKSRQIARDTLLMIGESWSDRSRAMAGDREDVA